MSANRLLLVVRVAIVVAALAGCLDFEEQTARVEHDQDNDRLTVVINYRGLYSSQNNFSSGDADDAEAQLQEALETETVALFSNWPFAWDLAELRTELKKPDGIDEDWPEELRQKLLTLVERIAVRQGGFYMDPGGRVCASQVVTVEKIQDSVQLVNTIVNEAIQLEAQQEEPGDPSAQQFLEYAQKNHTWVELKGHSFVVSVPITEKELYEGRCDSVEEVFEYLQGDNREIRLRGMKDLLSSPVLLWHEDGMLKVKCGLEGEPSVLVLMPRLGEYKPNLAEHIEQTYGLHLDGNLARYILHPDLPAVSVAGAPAETEAEEAARIMAPRLTKGERVRVLVHQLSTEPSEDYWAKLRAESSASGMDELEELADAELLESWRQWLQSQVPAFKEPEAVPEG